MRGCIIFFAIDYIAAAGPRRAQRRVDDQPAWLKNTDRPIRIALRYRAEVARTARGTRRAARLPARRRRLGVATGRHTGPARGRLRPFPWESSGRPPRQKV